MGPSATEHEKKRGVGVKMKYNRITYFFSSSTNLVRGEGGEGGSGEQAREEDTVWRSCCKGTIS